ncbi:MAG: hypothetical protein PF692_11535 [Kiritimatiellae bacterium]|jgi:alpha-L-rhamnosidase|nr:hypothetical protein [Kiritimatiellia bacterium]
MNEKNCSIIDPFYSDSKVYPDARGLSLFAERTGACWLYEFGALESWLLRKQRLDAFSSCINIGHPGSFRSYHTPLYARYSFDINELPNSFKIKCVACGLISLTVNGQSTLRLTADEAFIETTIDLLPHLTCGINNINIRVHSMDEPPTFMISSEHLETNSSWEISSDDNQWSAPDVYKVLDSGIFPHLESLPEAEVTCQSRSGDIFDFGREVIGRLLILGTDCTNLDISVGESIEETQRNNVCYKEQVSFDLELTANGDTTSSNHLALRYIKITGGEKISSNRVRLISKVYPVQYRGAFKSSDERLNTIWMHSAYTLHLCMMDLFVDGLKRDRLPWVGDLYLAGLANQYVFADQPIVQRTLLALYGDSPETQDFNTIIDYSLFWIIALRDATLYGGDMIFLQKMLPLLRRLLNALESRTDDNEFISSDKCQWIFIDWSPVEKDGYCAPVQMLYLMALEAARDIYAFCEMPEIGNALEVRTEKLREACNRSFWNKDFCAYVDTFQDGKQGKSVSRPTNLFAILSDCATREKANSIAKNILFRDDGPPAVGTPYMRSLEIRSLCHCGLVNEALAIVKSYWGGMLDAGATSFWEGYNPLEKGVKQFEFYGRPFGKSLCHAWSSGPVALLSGDCLGLRPTAPGWSKFRFEPQAHILVGTTIAVPTPKGEIEIQIDNTSITVNVPQGLKGTFYWQHNKYPLSNQTVVPFEIP